MGFGINGHRCRDCGLCFNSTWNTWSPVTMKFWDGHCPGCHGTHCETLPKPVKEWTKGEPVYWEE